MAQTGRFGDALLYAKAALKNYRKYGGSAAQQIQNAENLIAQIKDVMKK